MANQLFDVREHPGHQGAGGGGLVERDVIGNRVEIGHRRIVVQISSTIAEAFAGLGVGQNVRPSSTARSPSWQCLP